ncbi:MAG: nitrogenase component 1 [Treponema sp.]|nr:nitrogenase component 1 [Treponema sp.]
MSHLLFDLPPLSPDYSGVASVFHDLGALTVLHDASGCTGTYTGYDEPRWFGSSSPIFCSGLREMDAIMGDDGRLLEKIKAALRNMHAPCVSVIGSPVPMVIGFDFKGFASLVEHETGLPTFGFPTNGLHYYDQGQRDAYLAIAKRLLEKVPRRIRRTLNILGASALDGFDDPSLDILEAMLSAEGFTRLALWGERSSWEVLKESTVAELNWVVTAAALPLARFFEERFDIPFVVGLPIGKREQDRIFSAFELLSSGEKSAYQFPPIQVASDQKSETMIVGEALFCSSFRSYLETEVASGPVGIGTFFSQGKDLLGPGDILFSTEDEARQALSTPQLTWILADPLLKDLLPKDATPRFTPLPHRAVSGRLYPASLAPFFGATPLIP